MKTHHFWDQNDSLAQTRIFQKKKSGIFSMYTLPSFIMQNMNKIIRADIKKI